MPEGPRRKLYADLLAKITLRSIYEVFQHDQQHWVETVVFNGHVDAIDRGSGHAVRPCLISVRTTAAMFNEIELHGGAHRMSQEAQCRSIEESR